MAMTNEQLTQRVQDLTELVASIAQHMNIGHLIDPVKFPELAGAVTASSNGPTPMLAAGDQAPPQTTTGSKLQFSHLGDARGLVHFIATNQGTEPWSNPVSSGLIRVEASSIKKGRPEDVVDFSLRQGPSGQVFFTENIPYSWVCIDFGNYRIKPNCYCFSHRAGPPHLGYWMRSWELHASNDGETWVVIRKHTNDQSLNAGALAASWWIDDSGLQHYRYFRVVIDPEGNDARGSALVMSCFEIYGDWEFNMN